MAGPSVSYSVALPETTITRPADTTPYTPGDVVGAPFIWTGVCDEHRNNYSGSIDRGLLRSNANVAVKADFELWLFNSVIATVADNGAFVPTDAEMRTLVTVLDFLSTDWKIGHPGAGAAGNSVCMANDLNMQFKGIATALHGQLVIRSAYTPVSLEEFSVEAVISVDRN